MQLEKLSLPNFGIFWFLHNFLQILMSAIATLVKMEELVTTTSITTSAIAEWVLTESTVRVVSILQLHKTLFSSLLLFLRTLPLRQFTSLDLSKNVFQNFWCIQLMITIIAEIFICGLISYFSYFQLKVRNLVAYKNHARITVHVTLSSL